MFSPGYIHVFKKKLINIHIVFNYADSVETVINPLKSCKYILYIHIIYFT